MTLEKLVDGIQTAAVICLQFGDTGKGKIVDFLSEWADLIARGTGGNNAGHTVIVNGQERIYHLLPAGITYDGLGKVTVLGNGMVIDPEVLCKELDDLVSLGGTHNNLRISENANVITPWQVVRDKSRNQSQKDGGIGSTGRGIGPCYADKTARRGITMKDLFDKDVLAAKIRKAREFYPEQIIDVDETISRLEPHSKRLKEFVTSTAILVHEAYRQGKKILLEGAQGTLLSVEHGVPPYVTSSDCTINGTAGGVGLSAGAVGLVLGIVKFPFMTRVGGGPFPTELGGRESEIYCGETEENGAPAHTKEVELARHGIPHTVKGEGENKKVSYDPQHQEIIRLANSQNQFSQGVGIRLMANEYGATTRRPRRVGWTDAVSARYAVNINRPLKLVLTKVDSVAGVDEIKVGYGYNLDGRPVDFSRDARVQRGITPVLRGYAGYEDIRHANTFEDLPAGLRAAMSDFSGFVGADIAVVSTGPEKEQTIVL